MANDAIERLTVEFGADTSPYVREVEKLKTSVDRHTRDITKAANASGGALSSAAMTAALSIKGMVAAAVGFGAASLAQKAVTDAAALDKLARSAGLTKEAFQQIQLGAKLNGVTDDIGPALAKFADNAQLARSKAGELYETLKFAAPVLAQQLSQTKTTEQALELYAEAVRRVNGDEAKAILVKKGFGEAADALVPILARGAEGLAEMRKQSTELATAIDDRAVKASKNLKSELDLLATESTNKIANFLAPAFESLAAAANKARAAVRNGIHIDENGDLSTQAQRVSAGVAMAADNFDRMREAATQAASSASAWKTSVTAGFDLKQKPDYRGADAVQASVQALAAARGEVTRLAQLEGQTTIENARRMLEERAMGEAEFARIRTNTNAATEANILAARKQATEQLKALEAEALTARGEGFEAVRMWMDAELAKYQEQVRTKVISEQQFQAARENLNAIAAEKIKAENDRLKAEIEENTRDIAQAFENAIGGTLTGQFENAKEAAKSFTLTLLKGLQDAVTKALILEPIMKSIRGGLSSSMPNGIGGFLQGLGGSGAGQGVGSWATTTSFAAEGGGVRAGHAIGVNERKGRLPEVFIPDTAGRIVPGERARGMGGTGGSESNVYNIDARGSDAGVTDRIMQALVASQAQQAKSVEAQRSFAKRFPVRR